MSSFSSKFFRGKMGPRLSLKLIGLIIITIIAVIGPLVFVNADLDTTKTIPKCAAKKIDDLCQPICLSSEVPPPPPPVLESNCHISSYTINWTGLKITALIFAVPLPLYIFFKRRLSQASCMSQRVLWGFLLFFLIACVVIYLAELEGNRKKILNSLENSTGTQKSCNEARESADFEIMNIFWKVNPLNSIFKTVDILMDGMKRGRERSRVTKLWKELEILGEETTEKDYD